MCRHVFRYSAATPESRIVTNWIEKLSDPPHLVVIVITRREEHSLHYKSLLHFTSCRFQCTPISQNFTRPLRCNWPRHRRDRLLCKFVNSPLSRKQNGRREYTLDELAPNTLV